MRRALFWLHLIAALSAGLVIVVMSFTGALLMYEKQITAWADGYPVVRPSPQVPVSIEALLKGAQLARPGGSISSITLQAEPTAPANVSFGRDGSVFLNPYDATVLGEGSKAARAFFRSVTDWHRWLAREGDDRPTGRAITGAANLFFLFIVMTGPILWWPRSLTPAAFRNVTLVRGGLSGKARDFNRHNVIGFWAAIPLLFIVATGVVMSYPWANDLLYKMTGSQPPSQRALGPSTPSPRTDVPSSQLSADGLDVLWIRAQQQTPDWRSISVRIPSSAKAPVTFSIDSSAGAARPDKRAQLTLDRRTGEVVKFETYESQVRGRQLRTWARFIHTGEAFGLPGQTVAGLASTGVLVLAWTGFALSFRRFGAWRARRARKPSPGATLIENSARTSA